MSLHSGLRRVGGRAGTTVPRGAVCEPPNPPVPLHREALNTLPCGTDPAATPRTLSTSYCILSGYGKWRTKGGRSG